MPYLRVQKLEISCASTSICNKNNVEIHEISQSNTSIPVNWKKKINPIIYKFITIKLHIYRKMMSVKTNYPDNLSCIFISYYIELSLSAYFIRPFYKMMLQRDIKLNDMESVVSHYYVIITCNCDVTAPLFMTSNV